MSRSAAIFDLDRTLLLRSSARVFQEELAEAGLAPRVRRQLSDLFYRLFDVLGESGLAMQLVRFAPRSARGISIADVEAVAKAAAVKLADEVGPYARQLLDEHREAGRTIAIATTTPQHLVAPLAEMLDIPHVVATRWADEDGIFTGALAGSIVWGRGKLDAVREWAGDHDIDLAASYAYSDSYYDAPLLAAVGHPTAVNPDPRLSLVAMLRGWPVRHLDAPDGVVKIMGMELQELLRPFAREELIPNARIEISGIEHIPSEGGAIVCANHRSYFDSAVVSLVLAKAGRNARFLGKKEVFDAPVLGTLAKAAGGIRVDRGTGSDEPLDGAVAALRAGEVVGLMPQGTIPRGPAFFDPELKGRWGAARLAAMARVPVIPLGLWGTEHVWPRSSRLPKLSLIDPPLVTATVGPPVELKYRSADADTKRIMKAIAALLPAEARKRRKPSPEELARTYPPGYSGDPENELDRRPGTDT